MEPGARAPTGSYSVGVASGQHVPRSVPIAAPPAYVPLQPNSTPLMQHAIALQQYHFQQSLLNQQILAQQQAAANSASIKAAVEEAAARAAQISKILSGENAEQEKEKAQQSSPRRGRAEPLPRLRSRSMSLSSKSESVSPSRSPISYKHGCTEHGIGRYSSRDYSYRGNQRYSRYGIRGYDHGNYYRSSYRRDFDHRYHDRGYPSCHRSRGRSRRRSRSRSRRSLSRSRARHYNERSLSPQRHPNRCSPKSDSSSKEQACRISKSPVKSNSFISHLENSKSGSEEKHTDGGRLTPSRSSGGGRHTTGSANGDDDGVTSVGKNEKSKHVYICHKYVVSSPDKKLTENGSSSYSPRSSDHSAGKVTRGMQRSFMLASYSSDSGNHANPEGSNEALASRSPEATEEENILPSPHKRVHHESSNNRKNVNSDDTLGDLDALNRKRSPPEVKVRGHPGHDKHKNAFQADNVMPKRRSNTEVVKHKLSHLKEEPGCRQNMENFDEGIRSANDEELVAYSQIYQIREERSEDLVASTKKTFSDHKTVDEYLVARQGAMDSSSETGEDMNKNLMPYPSTTEAGDESNALEKIDDDQWGKIAIKGHGKKRSTRRSKSREKKSKHHKKHHRKHRREELEKNNLKRHKKHREEESENEEKSYKRNRRENSEEGDKHHKRHRRDDSEESEEKHHKKHKRADSEEEDFVEKHRSGSTKKNKNYARHKHGHRERKRRKCQTTSSSSSSSEHLPSSMEISDDVPSKKSAGYKGSKSSP